jgi:hypothetical protein
MRRPACVESDPDRPGFDGLGLSSIVSLATFLRPLKHCAWRAGPEFWPYWRRVEFPDLVWVRRECGLYAEAKSGRGMCSWMESPARKW